MREQRKEVRVPLRLEVQWDRSWNNTPDVTSDVSLGGCFVESLESVNVGDILGLRLRLPSKLTLPLLGEVRYYHPTIGFGIKFLDVPSLQRGILESLLFNATRHDAVAQAA